MRWTPGPRARHPSRATSRPTPRRTGPTSRPTSLVDDLDDGGRAEGADQTIVSGPVTPPAHALDESLVEPAAPAPAEHLRPDGRDAGGDRATCRAAPGSTRSIRPSSGSSSVHDAGRRGGGQVRFSVSASRLDLSKIMPGVNLRRSGHRAPAETGAEQAAPGSTPFDVETVFSSDHGRRPERPEPAPARCSSRSVPAEDDTGQLPPPHRVRGDEANGRGPFGPGSAMPHARRRVALAGVHHQGERERAALLHAGVAAVRPHGREVWFKSPATPKGSGSAPSDRQARPGRRRNFSRSPVPYCSRTSVIVT